MAGGEEWGSKKGESQDRRSCRAGGAKVNSGADLRWGGVGGHAKGVRERERRGCESDRVNEGGRKRTFNQIL
jgi:hypothetical protein